jgi:hypothetical protein
MHNGAGISIDYSRTTNHELTQCTPFIPLPRSVQGEPPLYQYWHGLEDRHHEGLPSDFGAPTQFGSNRAKLRGIHRPIEVPDSQHVAKCDILVSPGHNAAKAIQGSQNQHEELKPFTDAASAATNISSPVELLSIQRNNTPCFECCFARVSKLKVCRLVPLRVCKQMRSELIKKSARVFQENHALVALSWRFNCRGSSKGLLKCHISSLKSCSSI